MAGKNRVYCHRLTNYGPEHSDEVTHSQVFVSVRAMWIET